MQLIDSTVRSYFDAPTVTRLNRAANMCRPASGVCAPSHIHQALQWGPHKGGEDDASDVVYIGEEKLTVVVVAEFKGASCRNSQGVETDQLSVGFAPLVSKDFDFLVRFLAEWGSKAEGIVNLPMVASCD